MSIILLWTIIIILSISLFFLYKSHKNLQKKFRNYNPNPVFGPRPAWKKTDDYIREQRLEDIKYILSFKWVWYWATKEAREDRELRKKSKYLMKKLDKKIKMKKASSK